MTNAPQSKPCSTRQPHARPPITLPRLDPHIRFLLWCILELAWLRCTLLALWKDESTIIQEAFPYPLSFLMTSILSSFMLLFILPFHPMSIPTAIGGGISISLIISYVKPYRARNLRLPGGR